MAGLFILVVLNLYGARLKIDYLRKSGFKPSTLPNQDVLAQI